MGRLFLLPIKSTMAWWETSQPQLQSFILLLYFTCPDLCREMEQGDQTIRAALCHCSSHTFTLLQLMLLFLAISFLYGTSICFNKRSSTAVGGYLLHRDVHELHGDRLYHGLFQMLHSNLGSSSWSTSTPSFFNDLGVCRVAAVTDSHSSLSQF